MKQFTSALHVVCCWLGMTVCIAPVDSGLAAVIHEHTSAYHHIRVLESGGIRTLCFDDAEESTIAVSDPLKGHFEYTDYFHMGWLWNTQINNVLMIGLGGGSAQRSFEHYYPSVKVETVEIDPAVVQIAKAYFFFKESDRQKVHIGDGRMHLRRTSATYDLLIMDAYVQGRYGSSVPQHLATREFFELARNRMSTNGILAYNVIGSVKGFRPNLVGSLYRTLKSVFPQVYLFPAKSSLNIVMVATKAPVKPDMEALRRRADLLVKTGRVPTPFFRERLEVIRWVEPPNSQNCPILTDNYAPVEGLAGAR